MTPPRECRVEQLQAAAYRIPTESPESDGTLEWDATTLVVVTVAGGGKSGLGYTYGTPELVGLIQNKLAKLVLNGEAMNVTHHWQTMINSLRNLGRPGLCSTAVAAVDAALWDLKSRLLNLPLVTLLGQVRKGVAAYGSGGFTSSSISHLKTRLADWAEEGLTRVKMKVGRHPEEDVKRVRAAREAVGPSVDLYVDANGAYSCKQALEKAEQFAELGVRWFEEPVSSDDLAGLRLLRERAPSGMDIAAGEYGYDAGYFRRMLEAGAVDVLQADATRCAGITGLIQSAVLCRAFHTPLSAHTAPSLHVHPCCALEVVRHVEHFQEHVRIEQMLFDGAAVARDGELHPDLSRPGLGLELKTADADEYKL